MKLKMQQNEIFQIEIRSKIKKIPVYSWIFFYLFIFF